MGGNENKDVDIINKDSLIDAFHCVKSVVFRCVKSVRIRSFSGPYSVRMR